MSLIKRLILFCLGVALAYATARINLIGNLFSHDVIDPGLRGLSIWVASGLTIIVAAWSFLLLFSDRRDVFVSRWRILGVMALLIIDVGLMRMLNLVDPMDLMGSVMNASPTGLVTYAIVLLPAVAILVDFFLEGCIAIDRHTEQAGAHAVQVSTAVLERQQKEVLDAVKSLQGSMKELQSDSNLVLTALGWTEGDDEWEAPAETLSERIDGAADDVRNLHGRMQGVFSHLKRVENAIGDVNDAVGGGERPPLRAVNG